jgi:hypothetical protein
MGGIFVLGDLVGKIEWEKDRESWGKGMEIQGI